MATATSSPPGVPTTRAFTAWANRPQGPEDFPDLVEMAEQHSLKERNRTRFNPDEAPKERKAFYRRLDLHNRDAAVGREDLKVWNKIDTEYHDQLLEGMAFQLGLNKRQQRYAEALYESVDRQKIGRWCELIGFACCIHALDVGYSIRKYHPSRNDENNDSEFVRMADWLAERFPLDRWDVLSVLNKTEDRNL